MFDDLDSRLTVILANSDETAIIEGLKPLCARLVRLFGSADQSQFERQIQPFCRDYIALIPSISDEIVAIAQSLRLEPLITDHIKLAGRYLLSACDEIEQSPKSAGLEQFLILLQGAYIFNRMLEELDDKVEVFVGAPMSQTNMMDANLIVHEIIGEGFANRLDKIVSTLIKQSQVSKVIIEANLDQNAVQQAKLAHNSLAGQPVKNFAANYQLDMASRML